MIDAIGESIATTLVERALTVLGAGVVFWFGGALVWVVAHGGWAGLVSVGDQAAELSVVALLVVVAAVFVGVSASSMLVRRLTRPALRLLEGYWPWRFRVTARVAKVAARVRKDTTEFRALAGADLSDPAIRSRYVRLDLALRRYPGDLALLMPTRIGNVLRAAETRPHDKYGLDLVTVWPRLWLVLPDSARTRLTTARAALDQAVGAVLWGIAFTAFGFWHLAAVPVGLVLTAVAALWWVPARARTFADLLESAADMYRPALYKHLRWPLPGDPDAEREQGELITSYLARGLAGPVPALEV